jgi:lipopolysaccharide/colanic/teichoic acid biosynthesis glycosyltransferase
MKNRSFFKSLRQSYVLEGDKSVGLLVNGRGVAAAVQSSARANDFTEAGFRSDRDLETLQAPTISLPGPLYLGLKRVMDVGIAIMGLGFFGIILPVLALIIKIDSAGPVFYSQDRVGINRRQQRGGFNGKDRRTVLQPGKPFQVHKLRTMGVHAEAGGPQWAAKNDVRVTRVGRILRKTRLDEVPQFWNVLKGEMSLIGPRPERLVFVRQLEKDVPHYRERLLILPGITGLAQVINGYDDSLESVRRKIELDRTYIKNSGFKQDSKILLSTVGVVLKGEGAR